MPTGHILGPCAGSRRRRDAPPREGIGVARPWLLALLVCACLWPIRGGAAGPEFVSPPRAAWTWEDSDRRLCSIRLSECVSLRRKPAQSDLPLRFAPEWEDECRALDLLFELKCFGVRSGSWTWLGARLREIRGEDLPMRAVLPVGASLILSRSAPGAAIQVEWPSTVPGSESVQRDLVTAELLRGLALMEPPPEPIAPAPPPGAGVESPLPVEWLRGTSLLPPLDARSNASAAGSPRAVWGQDGLLRGMLRQGSMVARLAGAPLKWETGASIEVVRSWDTRVIKGSPREECATALVRVRGSLVPQPGSGLVPGDTLWRIQVDLVTATDEAATLWPWSYFPRAGSLDPDDPRPENPVVVRLRCWDEKLREGCEGMGVRLSDGSVLTCYHCLPEGMLCKALCGGTWSAMNDVALCAELDLAVIACSRGCGGSAYAPVPMDWAYARTGAAAVIESCSADGASSSVPSWVSQVRLVPRTGMICTIRPLILTPFAPVIGTRAARPGDSGSPAFDEKGHLLGIVQQQFEGLGGLCLGVDLEDRLHWRTPARARGDIQTSLVASVPRVVASSSGSLAALLAGLDRRSVGRLDRESYALALEIAVEALVSAGLPSTAMQLTRLLRELSPLSWAYWENHIATVTEMLETSLRLGRATDVSDLARDLVAFDPGRRSSWQLLVRAYEAAGQKEKARDACKAAMDLLGEGVPEDDPLREAQRRLNPPR